MTEEQVKLDPMNVELDHEIEAIRDLTKRFKITKITGGLSSEIQRQYDAPRRTRTLALEYRIEMAGGEPNALLEHQIAALEDINRFKVTGVWESTECIFEGQIDTGKRIWTVTTKYEV